jgi:hypothetical protein
MQMVTCAMLEALLPDSIALSCSVSECASGALQSTAATRLQQNTMAVGYAGLLPYHDAFAAGSSPALGWTN